MTVPTQPIRLSDCEHFDIMCSCSNYAQHYECLHYETVLGNVNNRIKIIAFRKRGITEKLLLWALNQWDALQIPAVEGEDVILGQLFRKDSIYPIFNLQQQFFMIIN